MINRTDAGVEWPPGYQRTPADERQSGGKFEVTRAEAAVRLEDELERMGAQSWEWDTDSSHKGPHGRPLADGTYDDPSVVVRWSMDDARYAAACDRYTSLRSNIRALGLYLREKRKMEARPVATGEAEMSNLRLPPGDGDATDGPDDPNPLGGYVQTDANARDLLGVERGATDERVREAYREKLKDVHPDHGGSATELKLVKSAYDRLTHPEKGDSA